MENIRTVDTMQAKEVQVLNRKKLSGMILFLVLLQGIILFGPQALGSWAHDNFHSYRHSIGMPCH